jgi:ubiquinone/menaquinone biosynthesis C-methylase UbiE
LLEKKGIKIRNLYDKTYDSYDVLYGDEQLEKYFVTLRHIRPKGLVLDVGCGTALLLEFLSKTYMLSDIDLYVCLDFSLGMLTKAIARTRSLCLRGGLKCLVIAGDAQSLPFKDNVFDIVYSFTVIDLLDDPLKGINEALRVSKGVAVISALKKLKTWKLLEQLGEKIGETDKDIIFLLNKFKLSKN